MRLSEFHYNLPLDLVAQYPLRFRDDAKMMVLHAKSNTIEHKNVKDIVDYFGEDDVMIFNDTKVLPSKLKATKEKTLASISVFLQRDLGGENNKFWDIQVQPARKIRIGNKIFFDDDTNIIAEVLDNTTSRGRTVRFLSDYQENFKEKLFAIGSMPLPDYVYRPLDGSDKKKYEKIFLDYPVKEMDFERFQTIFAQKDGSIEAPMSALNVSKSMVAKMEINGVKIGMLTSHIGLGLSKRIEVEDLYKHKIEADPVVIDEKLVEQVNDSLKKRKRICMVGAEVARGIQQVAGLSGTIKQFDGWTNLFIFPPYQFVTMNAFLTSFYQPFSPKLMLTCAFGGYKQVMEAYETAVKKKYRFGVYGDSFLILDD